LYSVIFFRDVVL